MPNKKNLRRGAAKIIKEAKDVLRIEAEGILNLVDRLGPEFAEAVHWIYKTRGRVIVTGIGKSGIVGRKIVATLNSTGTKALFLHPVEALHGDLGMVSPDDIVLALSNSGETEELTAILPTLRSLGTRIIALTGNLQSTLGRSSDLVIDAGVDREACPLGLAPTASTTAMLALGDALGVVLLNRKKFRPEDFHRCHPGGVLGERLQVPIREIMRIGSSVPLVKEGTSVAAALEEMDVKELGATLVVSDSARLVGIVTDGDLRRGLYKYEAILRKPVEAIMSPNPKTVQADGSVADALGIMEDHEITVLPVASGQGEIQGILHLHDLLGKGHIRFEP
ncbi:MAG: KpsF/GutQ family sugar-phosphate isomerase [Deltaproteobacteria bacterium]|nr:MAG: KpsF/GutQ family sugar-phosphate isomerase [Deltaproteobacteria bacterium]